MANHTNLDPKSPAGKQGFRFGTRGNRLVYVHCGKVARVVTKLTANYCQQSIVCAECHAEARIDSPCDRKIPHSHFGT